MFWSAKCNDCTKDQHFPFPPILYHLDFINLSNILDLQKGLINPWLNWLWFNVTFYPNSILSSVSCLWILLPATCFPANFGLQKFKWIVNRYLLSFCLLFYRLCYLMFLLFPFEGIRLKQMNNSSYDLKVVQNLYLQGCMNFS